MKPLRVAIVSREYPPFFGGGIGTYVRWIVPALINAGVRVHVITEAHDETQPRVELDGMLTVHRLPMSIGRGGWTNAAARFSVSVGKKITQLWQSDQIDIVEFAECEGAGVALSMLNTHQHRLPTIVQLHTPSEQLFALRSWTSTTLGPAELMYFNMERLALRRADEILAPSQFIADWAAEHYGVSKSPTVIPYATGVLPPVPVAPDERKKRVLFIGRVEPRKGVESLLLAWNQVIRDHPDAELDLAGADTSGAPGGGSMKAYLLNQVESHAQQSVRFLGKLNSSALSQAYGEANLCIIPSLWENFPNTCIESMSHARAVLVGDSGGMKEMIGSTQAGEVFRSGVVGDLYEKLSSMLGEGAGLIKRGQIARAQIEHLCCPERVAKLRIAHFEKVIALSKSCGECNQEQQAVLGVWKSFESVMKHDFANSGVPTLTPEVSQWVQRQGAKPC